MNSSENKLTPLQMNEADIRNIPNSFEKRIECNRTVLNLLKQLEYVHYKQIILNGLIINHCLSYRKSY